MPFYRRYSSNPGTTALSSLSGVVVIDGTAPASVAGLQTGMAGVVGEFADVSSGVTVDTSGNVTTRPTWTEVFSGQELLDLVGGFDETLGQFGGDFGNGFCFLAGKKFSRLAVCAINNASSKGARLTRELPTNTSATDTTPIVPLVPGIVPAGTEFLSGANRVRTAQRFVFSDAAPVVQGTDGSTTAGAAVTNNFTSASGDFVNNNITEGHILVFGIVGTGAGGTYRVVSRTSATVLVVQNLLGTSFDFGTTSSQPWRIHPMGTADSSPSAHQLVEDGGYTIPCRPLDAAIAGSTSISPTTAESAPSATNWTSLAGLKLTTIPTTGLTYVAGTQAANAANASAIDTLYGTVIDAALANTSPARDIQILLSARMSDTIRSKCKSHVITASGVGKGRRTFIGPEMDVLAVATWVGNTTSGVGATRDERVNYNLPGLIINVPEAVGFSIAKANGTTTSDGKIEIPGYGFAAQLRSNLPPENSIGQCADPVTALMSNVLDLQSGLPSMTMDVYKQLKSKGIMAWEKDPDIDAQFVIEAAVTSSLTSGRTEENRRSMADFIQDSIAAFLKPFKDLLITNNLKDGIGGAISGFLADLRSKNNPSAQRISGFSIDMDSGNTTTGLAAGLLTILVTVDLLPVAHTIVLSSTIGVGTLTVTQLQ